MFPRILLTGSTGQLGHELQNALRGSCTLLTPGRADYDLQAPASLRALVSAAAPNLILNCAAYTNVNAAESDHQAAYAVNAAAPGILAEEAARLGALLIHFSTDYVFPGDKPGPYSEADQPSPLNVYGASKLAGEAAIQASGCHHLIFRTSWVYSAHGHNFIKTMLELGRHRRTLQVVDDQVGAPTSSAQLTRAVQTVLARYTRQPASSGLYHLTAAGRVSWCGIARRIFARAAGHPGLIVREVTPVSSAAYPTPARRPLNSVLDNHKFHQHFGFTLEPWDQALDPVLADLGVLKPAHMEQ